MANPTGNDVCFWWIFPYHSISMFIYIILYNHPEIDRLFFFPRYSQILPGFLLTCETCTVHQLQTAGDFFGHLRAENGGTPTEKIKVS